MQISLKQPVRFNHPCFKKKQPTNKQTNNSQSSRILYRVLGFFQSSPVCPRWCLFGQLNNKLDRRFFLSHSTIKHNHTHTHTQILRIHTPPKSFCWSMENVESTSHMGECLRLNTLTSFLPSFVWLIGKRSSLSLSLSFLLFTYFFLCKALCNICPSLRSSLYFCAVPCTISFIFLNSMFCIYIYFIFMPIFNLVFTIFHQRK
jgi:hypothetical protein